MTQVSRSAGVLTAAGRTWAARAGAADCAALAADARKAYRSLRFVQIDDFVRGDLLAGIIQELMPRVRQYAVRITRPHEVSTGLLHGGRRFDRIDPGDFEGTDLDHPARAAVQAAFERCGLSGFVRSLLTEALPLFESVAERRLVYDRTFLLAYREADFIAPHGDTQTSRRVMIQMPVTSGCRTAMRVMRDGWMEPYYDDLGALRIHGPGIWHEVPPVLRLDGAAAERIVVTARLPYAGDE